MFFFAGGTARPLHLASLLPILELEAHVVIRKGPVRFQLGRLEEGIHNDIQSLISASG